MKTVFILTAGFGEGHNAAARAIETALSEHIADGISTKVIDIFARRTPRLNNVTRQAYIGLINRAPGLWSRVYRWMDRPNSGPVLMRLLNGPTRELGSLIRKHRPSAICATYPMYPWMMDKLMTGGLPPCARFTVVTDSISVNSLWHRAHSDLFFVPNQATATVLTDAGIPHARVDVTGFPVSPVFADRPVGWHPLPPGENNPPKILLLINSGREKAITTIKALLGQPDWNLTITTGRDAALRRHVEELTEPYAHRVQVHGWTDRIPEFLMTHHLVISKAGGATTQEAIAAHCPMIVNQIVPGQEEGNWELLKRHNAGAYADTPQAVVATIRGALENKALRWRQWRENLEALARPDAAREIATRIIPTMMPAFSEQQ